MHRSLWDSFGQQLEAVIHSWYWGVFFYLIVVSGWVTAPPLHFKVTPFKVFLCVYIF